MSNNKLKAVEKPCETKTAECVKAVRLSSGLYGLYNLDKQKKELLELFVNGKHITIYTNGIIEGIPSDWENIRVINYLPSMLAENLALIPNKWFSEFNITSEKGNISG